MKRIFILSAAIVLTALYGFSRQPERGYRGFVEWSNRYHHTNTYWNNIHLNYSEFYTGISTSHGYQFNPWLFVGAGIDYEVNHKDIRHLYFSNYTLSLFVQGRTDLKFGSFTPFADVRIGYNANSSEDGNLYFSPSIGYRFDLGRKVGLNVGIGYTLDRSRYEDYFEATTPEGWQIWVPTGIYHPYNKSYFSFRIGIDF
ncbi:MAG: hypothetical protein K2N09_08200 [Muribaculaceae bacterium]|nr:hypothetical protein [Muribaculaceae bacterium]